MILLEKIKGLASRDSFLKNVVIYGASNGISALSPFILLPVLTTYLTTSEFGEFSIFMLLIGVFSVVNGLNINGAISVNYFKLNKATFPTFVFNCFFLACLIFLVSLAICYFFGANLASFLKVDIEIILLSVVIGFFNVYYISCLAVMQASNHPFQFLKLKLSQTFIEIAFSIIFIAVIMYGLYGRVVSYGLAIFVCFMLSFWFLLKENFISVRPDRRYLKKAIIFGVPLLPHTLSGSAIMFTDRIVITNLIDNSATGIYMAGMQVGMIMMLLVEPINKAYSPWLFGKLSGERFDEFKHDIVKKSYLYYLILIIVALFLYFITDVIFLLLVNERFYAVKSSMLFFYFGFAFQGMYYAVTNYIFYAEKTGVLSAITIIVACVGILTSYVLVSLFGIKGAAISFMLTNLLLFLVVWYVSNRSIQMPWFDFVLAKVKVHG